jgi:hypothetical protein
MYSSFLRLRELRFGENSGFGKRGRGKGVEFPFLTLAL